MPKPLPILAGLLIAGGALALALYTQQARRSVEERVIASLNDLGFTQAASAAVSASGGTLTLSGIQLDAEGFSTIERITARHSRIPLPGDKDIKEILIENPVLTGELDIPGNFALAGREGGGKLEADTLRGLLARTERIALEGGRLDLLSTALGGLRIDVSGALSYDRNEDTMKLAGAVTTKQRPLNLSMFVSGTVDDATGAWEIHTRLEQGRVSARHFEVNRLYGEAFTAGHPGDNAILSGEFTAGQMSLYGYPVQNIAGTLEMEQDRLKIVAEGKSAAPGNADDLQLEFSFIYSSQSPDHYQISIFAPTMDSLLAYLGLPLREAVLYDIWPHIRGLQNFSLTLQAPLSFPPGQTEVILPLLIKKLDADTRIVAHAVLHKDKDADNFSIKTITLSKSKK